MAGKKATKKEVETKINEAIESVPQMSSLSETIEQEVIKTIENVSSEVAENLANIKTREKNIMQEIENNPAATGKIVEQEIQNVDKMIQTQMKKIEELAKEVKNNKVFTTTESWNGWGYDI